MDKNVGLCRSTLRSRNKKEYGYQNGLKLLHLKLSFHYLHLRSVPSVWTPWPLTTPPPSPYDPGIPLSPSNLLHLLHNLSHINITSIHVNHCFVSEVLSIFHWDYYLSEVLSIFHWFNSEVLIINLPLIEQQSFINLPLI